uniref:Ig-like domain-containing protein n=1 Tax=Phasianus colchicus TaxID=9054 RepID=A0A669QAZ2_PHACC
MTPMALALILGWWLVAACRAQHLSRPSLSLHPSQGVSLGENVTLRCHLPQLAARVRLYKEGRWIHSNYKYKEQDTAEFSFLNTNREHAGRYFCQYQVSWSAVESEKSDPVELVLTGAADSSHGNLVVAVVGGCTAAFLFILVLAIFFLLAGCRRQIQRDESAPAEKHEDMEFQVPSSDSEGLTYVELQAVTPSSQPLNPPADPQPSVIYAEIAVGRHH